MIATIVTRGYGTFGSIADVVTAGYIVRVATGEDLLGGKGRVKAAVKEKRKPLTQAEIEGLRVAFGEINVAPATEGAILEKVDDDILLILALIEAHNS